MAMNEIDYAARVAKGVALLDEKRPGWERLINLEALDIENGSRCVTAQLYPNRDYPTDSWYKGMHALGLTSGDTGTYIGHGFNAEACDGDHGGSGECPQNDVFATLNTLWKALITTRLASQDAG